MSSLTASTHPPTPHVLHQTQLEIRLQPNQNDRSRPFQPGDVLRGEVSLVNPNADGVQDVKHRLRVGGIWVRYFWEARSHEPEASQQTYYRGSSTTISLIQGSVEDVLLMPGNFGGNALEASWAFEFTIPEKSTLTFASLPSPSGPGKSPSPSLAAIPLSGPPPSFSSSSSPFHVEHILEAVVAFADPSSDITAPSTPTKEMVDERGYRVGGEMETVERIVISCGGGEGEDSVKVGEEDRRTICQTVEVGEGGKGGCLQVSLTPPFLPLTLPPHSINLPLNLRLLPPSTTSASLSSTTPKKKSGGLFSALGGNKGKDKKVEEALAASKSEFESQSFTIGSVVGVFAQEMGEGDEEAVKIALPPSILNISSSHPTLSSPNGLDTTLHLTFPLPSRFPAAFDPSVGSFRVGSFERKFTLALSLTLTGSSSSPIPLQTLTLPSIPQSYLPPPPPTPSSHGLLPPSFDEAGHGFDHSAQHHEPMMAPPPGIDEIQGGGVAGVGDRPPEFREAMGEGGSAGGGGGGGGEVRDERGVVRGQGGHDVGGDLPPGYD